MGTSSAGLQRLTRAQGASQHRFAANPGFVNSRHVNASIMASAEPSSDQSLGHRQIQNMSVQPGLSGESIIDSSALIFPSSDGALDFKRNPMASGA